jgi:hypothetical protein
LPGIATASRDVPNPIKVTTSQSGEST